MENEYRIYVSVQSKYHLYYFQSNLRRHKYHLFTSFDTGNMIREKDSQVEFEVSIGDYGNSLSLQGGVNPSTTQPSNAGQSSMKCCLTILPVHTLINLYLLNCFEVNDRAN